MTNDSNVVILIIPMAAPSSNREWRNYNGRAVLNKEVKEFNQIVALTLRGQHVPNDWPFYRVEIVVEPKRRSGDTDNRQKPVLDALTKCGFWPDDKNVAFSSSQFGDVHKPFGRTFVRITRMEKKFDTNQTFVKELNI